MESLESRNLESGVADYRYNAGVCIIKVNYDKEMHTKVLNIHTTVNHCVKVVSDAFLSILCEIRKERRKSGKSEADVLVVREQEGRWISHCRKPSGKGKTVGNKEKMNE